MTVSVSKGPLSIGLKSHVDVDFNPEAAVVYDPYEIKSFGDLDAEYDAVFDLDTYTEAAAAAIDQLKQLYDNLTAVSDLKVGQKNGIEFGISHSSDGVTGLTATHKGSKIKGEIKTDGSMSISRPKVGELTIDLDAPGEQKMNVNFEGRDFVPRNCHLLNQGPTFEPRRMEVDPVASHR